MSDGNEENDDTSQGHVWKSYLYQEQLKAPKPLKIPCRVQVPGRPRYYGDEFHGTIPRVEAEQLVRKTEGMYLTRESQRQPGTYALTFRFGNVSRNYRLYYDENENMHYVGETRFEKIHDLVADGLIALHMRTCARDYIDHMAVAPAIQEEKPKDTTDRNELFVGDIKASAGELKKRHSFKPSEVKKKHTFKVHNFYGPHWCDYCRNYMWGLKAQGCKCQDCGYNAHKPCSQILPADCSPDKKLVKRVFGVDLTTFVKAHNQKRPLIVERCVSEVEKRGMTAEGIYRVSGFQDTVELLKNTIDKDGEVPDLSQPMYDDINAVTGLIKLYFRLLPIPLIDFEAYEPFIAAIKIEKTYEKSRAFQSALAILSPAHYETLKYFARHLQRVARFHEKNLMTFQNLAIIFGPTLMRAPDSAELQGIQDLAFQRQVIEYLVSQQDILFST